MGERLQKTFSELQSLHYDAVVVAGDFNAPSVESGNFDSPFVMTSWRNSALSSYLCTGRVPSGVWEWGLDVAPVAGLEGHNLFFEPVYRPGGTFTSSKRIGEARCRTAMVDQIWFLARLQLTSACDPFFDHEFRRCVLTQGLPNLLNPSDHLPLAATFRFHMNRS